MSPTGLIDLDELVLRCRDEQARDYIREAVSCYRGGAYRACIVATWVAVIFDFIHKLRELDRTGDRRARDALKEFEEIRERGEGAVREALQFERDVLRRAAEEFELLTPLERGDLDRLQTDRHRCAHPTMQSAEEPYEPTAELARTHLRNAVEILLAREPVQGKAAMDRIWADIKSAYFPTDPAAAQEYFESGPLVRARKSLVRGLVIGLTKDLLLEARSGHERQRQLAALGAVIEMHRERAETVLQSILHDLLGGLDDSLWWHALELFRFVPLAWNAAGEPMRRKAQRVVQSTPLTTTAEVMRIVDNALEVEDLRGSAIDRLDDLDAFEVGVLPPRSMRPEYVEAIVKKCETVDRYTEVRDLRDTSLPNVVDQLSRSQYKRVVGALTGNPTIRNYMGWVGFVGEIVEATEERAEEAEEEWAAVYERLSAEDADQAQLRSKLERAIPTLANSGDQAAIPSGLSEDGTDEEAES